MAPPGQTWIRCTSQLSEGLRGPCESRHTDFMWFSDPGTGKRPAQEFPVGDLAPSQALEQL